jgi:serine/threonine protein kinase, bacterial
MRLTSGQTVAGYTVVRLLGAGGMGEVYLAQHPRLPRQDAFKVLHAEGASDSDFRERFIREADLAATLTHPNIVTVYDRGEVDGQLWISSQYIEGTDAAQMLEEHYPHGMPADLVADIVTGIASALDFANSHGLLHRDVKPANILLSGPDRDGARHVYLADFGIARNLAEANGLTATGMTVGTFAYSAPEQLLGEDVDGRADQYSLAATAYHLLTGSRLFPNSNVAVIINHQLNKAPPNLADTRPDLAHLDPVFRVALAKRPEERFRQCSDFARALAEQIGSPAAIGPADPTLAAPAPNRDDENPTPHPVPARRRPGRARTRAVAAGAAAGAVLVGSAVLLWKPWQQAPATEPGRAAVAVQTVTDAPAAAGAMSAHAAAEAIKAAVPEVTEIIDKTHENDGNRLLGRPNGYVAASVLVDSRAGCLGGPGVDCGAVVEQFLDESAASRRADYLRALGKAAPMLANEWSVVKGDLLLRISGELAPAQAKAYEAAFSAASP